MDNVRDLLQNKQVMMINVADNILITRADFEEWEELKKSKVGNWWNSLAEFCEHAPVSPNVMADILKMPELRAQIELTKTNPNGWVEYATGKGTSWYFKESKAREWLENDYAKWRLFYLERYKGKHFQNT